MNCKKGDLAVVTFVSLPKYQANVGRIVRVLRRARSQEYGGFGMLARWWVSSEGTAMVSSCGPALEGQMADIALRPILPLEEPETVKRREEITA